MTTPPPEEIRRLRRDQLLRARKRRNMLIEQQLANPRARKAVPQWIVKDLSSSYRRASAKLLRLSEKGVGVRGC